MQDFKTFCTKLWELYSGFANIEQGHALSIAGIHATILSIMIGLLSAYFFYINNQKDEIEKNAIEIASEINKITISPAWNKLVFGTTLFSEKWPHQQHPMDAWLTHFVLDPLLGKVFEESLKDTSPLKVYRDMGFNDTEIRLCIMASILFRNPFPKIMIRGEKAHGLNPNDYDYRIFRDKKDLEIWVKDIDKFRQPVDILRFFGTDRFTESFDWEVEINLLKRFYNNDQPLRQEEKQELKKFPKEFVEHLFYVWDISRIVRSKLGRIDFLNNSSLSKFEFKVIILSSLFVFFLSVIFPLFTNSIKSLYIVWIPSAYYFAVSAYFIFKLLR